MMALLLAFVLHVDSRLSGSLHAFPGTTVIEVGDGVRTPGQEFRFGYAVVNRSEDEVAGYFANKWRNEGWPTVVERSPDHHLIVAAFDTRRGLQRTVIVAREDRKTIVFSVLADLWPNTSRTQFKPRESESGLRLDEITWLDDSQQTSQINSYVQGDLQSAKEQLTRALSEQGYVLVEQRQAGEGAREVVFEHKRGREVAISVLRSVSPSLTAVSQIVVVAQ